MPVEKKDQPVLKRKKSVCSDSGMRKKEAKKQEVRRKPWHYLVKFLSKRPSRANIQPKKKRAHKPHNNRSRPTSKTKKNIRLNEVSLPRSSLFYASNLSETFPKNHVMETSPVSMAGARRLAQQIFLQERFLATSRSSGGAVGTEKRDDQTVKNVSAASTTPTPKKQKPSRLPKKLKRVQPLLLKFLARHKKCPFRTLLRHHCFYAQERVKKSKKTRTLQRIPSSVKMMYHKRSWKSRTKSSKHARRKKKGVKVDGLVYRYAVNNYTKHDQVVRFVQCICHKVVPKELWGSPENKATFLRNVAKFIRLHRAETFTLGQLTAGIKVSRCEWLNEKGTEKKHIPLTDSLKQQELLAQFIWWFVTKYLMPVLKAFFYITESGTHRQRVFFYRKAVWKKIHQFGLNTFCGEFFKPLKTTEANKLLRRQSSLGFSLLRFVPKSLTVRPITNMRHCPSKELATPARKQQSVNMKLQNLFEVLKYEKERNPKSLGATLFGADDFYQALKPFVARVRASLEKRPLYFVHVDVSHCYESILHQKLFDIIKEVLQEEEYLIRRFALLRMSAGKVYREFLKHVSTADDCRSFPDFFRHLVTAWKLKQVIAVDNVWYVTEDRDKLVQKLGEHIFLNIVKIGNSYYQQERGIAQGSILSTMLCGFYYSQMERTHLPEISQDPDSLLLRWVDDFLLITPQKSLADKFLNVMHAGIPEYGCFINHDKTLTNYDAVTADGKEVKRVSASEKFPWCGFLLDTDTLEVSPDLSRYTGLLLRDTLTVSLNAHPGESLRRKLLYSVRPKCHPLLLDQNLNTRQGILLNVYHVFLLTAHKFHTYAKELPRGGQPMDNPSFFCRLILDLAQYFHSASSRKCRQLSPREVTFSLDEREVTWLCLHAFQACLGKKQSRYGEVLRFLRKGLSQLRLPAEDFKIIMDTSKHAVFKQIK
ncbi:hypothetical protein ACROYT_G019110 [Oculina patagonica]